LQETFGTDGKAPDPTAARKNLEQMAQHRIQLQHSMLRD